VGDYFVRLLEATAFPESSRAELGVGADCFLHLSVADIRQVVLCSAADQAFALPASSVVFHWGAKAARHLLVATASPELSPAESDVPDDCSVRQAAVSRPAVRAD
jgi:hypothetical protein